MSLLKYSNQFPTFLDRFLENDMFDWSNKNFSTTNTTLPSVNIKAGEEDFTVEMVAPGFEKGDFKIDLNNNLLTISSDKKVENELKEGEQFTRKEFSYQSFTRSFTLPDIADGERITAKYENGILNVIIPKKEEAKPKPPKQIEIM